MNKLTDASSYALDLIRVISAQIVLIGHAMSFYGVYPNKFPDIQNIGVVIFFILSGFIISYTISSKIKMKKGAYTFTEYFIERFSRIYSGYIPAVIFVILIDSLYILVFPDNYPYKSNFNIETAIANIFMIQTYPLSHILPLGSNGPVWTLVIEWWLYMAFGWLVIRIINLKDFSIKSTSVLLVLSIVPIYNPNC